MLTIQIKDLEVQFRVGVPDEERAQPQRLLLSLVLVPASVVSTRSDDLRDTVDYYEVSRLLLALGKERSWRLIETLAGDVAELLLQRYPLRRVTVEVKKFIIPEARWVSVGWEKNAGEGPAS
jgi:dihydroneopterin aldolase